jgi:nicotinamidase/pyrazinamidase
MMDANKTLFIDIDTQRDFCLPTGSLAVDNAPIEAFRRLTALAVEKGIPIVGSVDAHPYDDAEFEVFPAHCVRGTEGQLKVEGSLPERSRFIPWTAPRFLCAFPPVATEALYFEKVTFSIFDNPSAEALLTSLSDYTFVVYGVATEYCVKAAVLGLCERGFEVIVINDAVAGVTPETTQAAWVEMAEAGAKFRPEAWLVKELAEEAA